MSKAKRRRKAAGIVYVVERAAGFAAASSDALPPDFADLTEDDFADMDLDAFENPTSYVPVAAFADRAAAEAERDRLEADLRAALPPGEFLDGQGWERAGGAKGVAAGLVALGLAPPKFGRNEYEQVDAFRKWWAGAVGGVTPEQRAGVWELFAGVRVYRVVERPMGD